MYRMHQKTEHDRHSNTHTTFWLSDSTDIYGNKIMLEMHDLTLWCNKLTTSIIYQQVLNVPPDNSSKSARMAWCGTKTQQFSKSNTPPLAGDLPFYE